MSKLYVTLLGKAVRKAARLRGNGSALPGLVVEKIDPNFIKDTLASLAYGVVIVSGTNGKTTTTKMVVELLEAQGLRVFTNKTGSNFTRGVAAALLSEVTVSGKLHADIAVLELDEAHATHFVATIKPRYSLILNVLRDQLDRFGEIDYTTSLLARIAEATTGQVVLNREDARIASLSSVVSDGTKTSYFGLSDELLPTFPSDDDIRSTSKKARSTLAADVILQSFTKDIATFVLSDKRVIQTSLKLTGIYNVLNAAAAVALVHAILGDELKLDTLTSSLATITPAFGRGEVITVEGQPVELVLVKNPSGFRLGLESYSPAGYATMIAINDNYADGRDMSWLWDVEFESLKELGVAQIAGMRAYDMALRLQYDEVPVGSVETDIQKAVAHFIAENQKTPKRIYCTYTAMLTIRKYLSTITKVSHL